MPYLPNEREYRSIPLERMLGNEEKEYRVSGYATTFSDPYTLFSYEGIDYKEQIDPNAIDADTDMSDVIFQYDHSGMVFARMSNGTLKLTTDERGLKVEADLSKTSDARNMFENIDSGMVKEMSWAFTVDRNEYDETNHIRTIRHIKRIYDVSAVSLPANPNTDIAAARSYIDGEIEKAKEEFLKREQQKKRIRLLIDTRR